MTPCCIARCARPAAWAVKFRHSREALHYCEHHHAAARHPSSPRARGWPEADIDAEWRTAETEAM